MKLQETNLVPPIVKDYLEKKVSLKSFLSSWHNTEDIEAQFQNRNFPQVDRDILVQHLLNQYKNAGIETDNDSKVLQNIRSLENSNTYTITTGHQLSLFGGTLFMSYKILTAIKLAAELNTRYPEQNFVPVFWLASEDHDFEEIKSTYVFGKTVSWNKDSLNQPTGKLPLDGLTEIIAEIKTLLGNKDQALIWGKKIETAYQNSGNLGEASLRFYHSLFEEFGLLIIDPNTKELKQRLTQVMHKDILEHKTYEAQSITDKILEQNYKLQINARPLNFFYLDEKSGRKMIKFVGEKFILGEGGIELTKEEMSMEINVHPERFSPNVNLRPVYQELILPNLAYIGGPAEIAYWMQLKSVFDTYLVPFPTLVLRFMNLIIGKGFEEKVLKSGLEIKDILSDEKTLTQKLIENNQPFNFQEKFENILEQMQELVDNGRILNNDLGKEFLETKLTLKDFFKSKSTAIKKALEQNEVAQIEKVLKLRSRIFPSGVFQERIETLMQQEVMNDKPLLNELYELVEPFSGELFIVEH